MKTIKYFLIDRMSEQVTELKVTNASNAVKVFNCIKSLCPNKQALALCTNECRTVWEDGSYFENGKYHKAQ